MLNQSPIPIAPPNHFLPTPVKLSPLINLLSGYEQTIFNQLIYGFSFGFSLHFDGETRFLESKNLSSALEHPSIVDMKLTKELVAFRVAGPFAAPPFHSFCVSPLGVVPNQTTGDFRLIHHVVPKRGIGK